MDKPKMTDQRWAEIAQLVIGHLVREIGIDLNYNSVRHLKDLANRLKIPFDELQNFARPFAKQMLDETYGKEKN